jgi:hypothetical protein
MGSMFTIKAPAQLLEGLTAVLGFAPVESLVVVALSGSGAVVCVLRADLRDSEAAGALERLADLAADTGAASVVAVFVSRESALCPVCAEQFAEVSARLAELLAAKGARLAGGFVVDEIAAGGRWQCVDGCGARGVLGDPLSSPLAAAAVLSGRRLYRDRVELAARVAVDAAAAAAVAAVMPTSAEPVCVRDAVRDAVAAARRMGAGETVEAQDLARVGASLTDVRVRDRLSTLAVSELAAGAELLWTALARALPQPWRAEALALLAHAAYVRGEGPLAGVALAAALAEVPDHRFSGLLDQALQAGIQPEAVRGLLESVPSALSA